MQFAEGSYDFNDHTELPIPRLKDDQHGTRCAGEIAAVPNDVCGVGVAYDSKIAGVRILSAPISDADEAAALNYAYQLNDIYSCSWGPPDDGRSMEAPDGLILKAMVNGVQKGRDGKGSVFVFAAGNGGGSDDQCNFDGYTNSIFSVTVGAVDRKGLHPYYSEMCAAMMVVAPSSGSGDHIVGHCVCPLRSIDFLCSIQQTLERISAHTAMAELLRLHLSLLESSLSPFPCAPTLLGETFNILPCGMLFSSTLMIQLGS